MVTAVLFLAAHLAPAGEKTLPAPEKDGAPALDKKTQKPGKPLKPKAGNGKQNPEKRKAKEEKKNREEKKDERAKRKKARDNRPRGLIVSPGGRLNQVDIAHFTIAQIYLHENKFDLSIEELKKVTENSPDRTARGAAWFSLGNIFLVKKKDPKNAVVCFVRVEGPLEKQARQRIIGLIKREKGPEEAVKALEEYADKTENKADEASIRLTLALFHQKNQNNEAALEQLKKVASMDYRDLRNDRREAREKKQREKSKAHKPEKDKKAGKKNDKEDPGPKPEEKPDKPAPEEDEDF